MTRSRPVGVGGEAGTGPHSCQARNRAAIQPWPLCPAPGASSLHPKARQCGDTGARRLSPSREGTQAQSWPDPGSGPGPATCELGTPGDCLSEPQSPHLQGGGDRGPPPARLGWMADNKHSNVGTDSRQVPTGRGPAPSPQHAHTAGAQSVATEPAWRPHTHP